MSSAQSRPEPIYSEDLNTGRAIAGIKILNPLTVD
jgi:predicted nucleic acid-binding protein